jgi:adenylosuccinate lyase
MAEIGEVPADAVARLRAKAEAERARIVDPGPGRGDRGHHPARRDRLPHPRRGGLRRGRAFLHKGLTSSDLLDTTLAVQLRAASDLLLADVDRVLAALEARAFEHKLTPCIGRSHGIHAEPTTFGLKLASFHAEFSATATGSLAARDEVGTCADVGRGRDLRQRRPAGGAARWPSGSGSGRSRSRPR